VNNSSAADDIMLEHT